MKYIIAEAMSHEPIISESDDKLYSARALDSTSDKYIVIAKILESKPCSYFLQVGQYLAEYLGRNEPLVFVTDWTDPCELKGLRLTIDSKIKDYPTLAFFAFTPIGTIFLHLALRLFLRTNFHMYGCFG